MHAYPTLHLTLHGNAADVDHNCNGCGVTVVAMVCISHGVRRKTKELNQWPVVSPGGCMWVLLPVHAPVHPSYACVVLLFTYSLSQ